MERREQAIAIWIGSTGNGKNPIVNGRRQPSCDGTSRMNREVHVRICERLGVKGPGPTRRCCRKIGLFGGMSTETGLIEAPNRLKPVLLILSATQVSREWRPLSTIGGRWLGVLTSLDFAR